MINVTFCAKCGERLQINDTKMIANGAVTWRRKICPKCKRLSYTVETPTILTTEKMRKLYSEKPDYLKKDYQTAEEILSKFSENGNGMLSEDLIWALHLAINTIDERAKNGQTV